MDNICNICGGSYVYKNGKWICSCCDNIKNEKITNEEVILLTNASAKLRMAAFDDAEELYRDFVKKYPKNPEGYWGLLLSKYGIKYEEDYDGKKVPTIYATSIESVLEDKNYQLAVEYADKDQKRYYKQQAQQFENIRQEWIEKASKEPPVDVFICFKDSDEEHNITRTDDSYEAQNLYTYLISKGYSVFFSRESLRDKVAEKYEPYIFNALNTAKVMVVYSSSREYMESTWVKNEWTRFLKKIKNGEKQKNSLVVSFEKMTASDLPKAFASCQCMDASKKTFYEDLDNHIRKVINESSVPTAKIDRVELGSAKKQKTAAKAIENLKTRDLSKYKVQQLTADEKTELKTAKICLSKELFDDALQSANRLLEINPNNGQALYIKLCAEENISSEEDLVAKAGTIKKINRFETIIENSSKEDSINLLNMLVSGCSLLIKKNNIEKALEYYNLISQYDFDYKNIVEDLKNKAYRLVDSKNYNLVERIVSSLLKTITDTNEYLDVLKNLIIGFRKGGERELTLDYCKKYIEVFDCDYEILWIKLCAEIGCLDDSVLHNYVANLKDFDSFKTILEYSPTEEKRNLYITTTLNAVVKKIQSKEIEKIDLLTKVFDEAIKYTSKKNKEKTLQIVLKMASACQLNYKFDLSEKYFAIALSENKSCHEAYWGLLQSKLKARNNNELIEQPTIISTMPDFHSAIAAAGDDERISEKYIDIKAKQLKHIEHKAEVDKAKKKKKRKIKIISIIVAIALAIGAALGGYGVYYSSENKLLYTLSEDGKGYIVSAGKFYDENVITIPETYNGKEVIGIAENAFKNKNLTSLNIPSTVQEIDDNAFYGCDNLANIKFDGTLYQGIYLSDLTTIGNYAFYGCSELKTVQLPESVESVGKYAFANCNKLNSINLTSNISELPEGLFENSFSYTISSISIPKNIDYIGKNVFNNCTKLSKIFIDEREEIPHNWDNNWCGNNTNNYEIIWTLKVDLNYNGGTSTSNKTSISVVLGEKYACPVPTKLGYIFEGWGYTKNEQYTLLTDEEGVSYDVWNFEEGFTLEAKWTARDYEISYQLNGGENHNSNPSSFTIETDTFELQNPTRDFYEFGGWYTNSSLTNPITSIQKGTTGHIGVYAKWIPIEYNISYNLDGGINNQINPLTYNVEDNIVLADPMKDGYIFRGWFKESTFENEVTGINLQYYGNPYNLYAKWELATYNINYQLYGGTNNDGNTTSYTILTDDIVLQNPSKEHYNFDGWYTESNYRNKKEIIQKGSFGIINLYAKWTPKEYVINYVLNDGLNSQLNPNTYNIEQYVSFKNPTRDGYTFVGWYTESTFVNKIDVINREFWGTSITLYAKWEVTTNTINYVTNGGVLDNRNENSFTILSDDITLYGADRVGYDFEGWYNNSSFNGNKVTNIPKGSFGNITLYAKYNSLYNISGNVITGVTDYTKSTYSEITIPEEIDGTAILGLGAYAFEGYTKLEKLVVPATITNITVGAFSGCSNLKDLTVPFVGEKIDSTTTNAVLGHSFGVRTYEGCVATTQQYRDTSYTNHKLTYYIPESLEKITVLGGRLYYGAFNNCSMLREIILCEGVESIGNLAVTYCSSLREITLPSTIKTIGNDAFSNSMLIESVYYNGSLENWAEISFSTDMSNPMYQADHFYLTSDKDNEITSLDLSNTELTSISSYAFFAFKNVSNINLPNGLQSIGTKAFAKCIGISSIEVPNTVTSIGMGAFGGCSNLVSIIIPFTGSSATSTYGNFGYIFGQTSYEGTTLVSQRYKSSSTSTDSYYIPSNLTTVKVSCPTLKYGAFYGCTMLKNVEIGEGVETIKSAVFINCSSLENITLPMSLVKIEDWVFTTSSNPLLDKIYYNGTITDWVKIEFISSSSTPMSCANHFYLTSDKDNEITSLDLSGITEISNYAFYGFVNVDEVATSNSLLTIGTYSFAKCSSLTQLELPISVTSIGANAFSGCSGLTDMVIPFVGESRTSKNTNFGYIFGSSNYTGATSISQSYKSGGSTGTTTYYIPTSLTTLTILDGNLGYGALSGCKTLTQINLPDTMQSMDYYAVGSCPGITSITLPKSIVKYGESVFNNCTNLSNIYYEGTIADWVKIEFVGSYSNPMYEADHFYLTSDKDNEITSLDLSGITEISNYAFYGFNNLTKVIAGNTLKTISAYAFAWCSNLAEVNLEGVETINAMAFYENDKLVSIEIPKTTKYIGNNAFRATGLKYAYIPTTVETIVGASESNSAFYDSTSLTIYIDGSAANPNWDRYWNYNRSVIYEIEVEEFRYLANFKEEDYTLIDGVYYYINADKSKVYALGVADKTVTDINLYSITNRIGYKAFANCSKLKNITLRGSITRIADKAFDGCSVLTNVYYDGTMENWSNTTIGNVKATTNFTSTPMYYADHFFTKNGENWSEITEIIIPESITKIKMLSFMGFEYVTSVQIHNNVTLIGNCAFYGCTRLTNIKIGENVSYIGNRAFYDCNALKSIYIPKSVTQISTKNNSGYSYSPFYECSSSLKIYCGAYEQQEGWETYWNYYTNYKLTVYYDYEYEEYLFAIATDKSSFTLINNVYYYINEDENKVYALGVNDKTATEIVLDERTTRISPIAFKNCTALTSIVIPNEVEYIALEAFIGCTNLSTIYVDSAEIYNSLESIYSCGSAFLNSTTIYVLETIVNTETSNEYLNNADVFNKVEEGEYFKYSRI